MHANVYQIMQKYLTVLKSRLISTKVTHFQKNLEIISLVTIKNTPKTTQCNVKSNNTGQGHSKRI